MTILKAAIKEAARHLLAMGLRPGDKIFIYTKIQVAKNQKDGTIVVFAVQHNIPFCLTEAIKVKEIYAVPPAVAVSIYEEWLSHFKTTLTKFPSEQYLLHFRL